jgi:hypothetical protein
VPNTIQPTSTAFGVNIFIKMGLEAIKAISATIKLDTSKYSNNFSKAIRTDECIRDFHTPTYSPWRAEIRFGVRYVDL